MELTIDLIFSGLTIFASFLAAILSFLNFRQSKRATFSDVITRNRLKWNDDLRHASVELFTTYALEPNSQNRKLFEASYFKLLLLFNSSRDEYRNLEKILLNYYESFDNLKIVDHSKLIEQVRFIAANNYNRAKDESGSIEYKE